MQSRTGLPYMIPNLQLGTSKLLLRRKWGNRIPRQFRKKRKQALIVVYKPRPTGTVTFAMGAENFGSVGRDTLKNGMKIKSVLEGCIAMSMEGLSSTQFPLKNSKHFRIYNPRWRKHSRLEY